VIFSKPKQDSYDLVETKTQLLEEQIEERDDELTRALAMKVEFIKNLNHEIRTPITGITSFSSALYDVYKTLTPEKLDSYLKAVATSSERLISLMDNILDLSKLASENYQLILKPVNLSELVYEVLEKTKKLYITDQDLEFVTNVEKNIISNCDIHYIRSTIYNLIINAIKFSQNGKIIISLIKRENKIKFIIQDEGIGIPTIELLTIFKPFIESSRTHSKAGGRGVGLALCKKTIELHGGKIWAESNGKKGAIFYFTLKI
jgi:signal transduction histidine kinase